LDILQFIEQRKWPTNPQEKLTKKQTEENIFTTCTLIPGVMDRLKPVNKVPYNVEGTILNVLQSISVKDFNSVFKRLQDNQFLGLSVQQKIMEKILVLLPYTRLLTKGVWKGRQRIWRRRQSKECWGQLEEDSSK
jgi:hypothetical protein